MKDEAKVVSLHAFKQVKRLSHSQDNYAARIQKMDKVELLNEMIRFQEERSRVGKLTLPMMLRGQVLFRELEAHAETSELKLLTGSYKRHLDYEIKEYVRQNPAKSRSYFKKSTIKIKD